MRFRFEILACALVMARTASAEPTRADQSGSRTDTSFGRIDGDLGVVFGAGVAIGPRAPRGALDLRVRYIDTIGLFATYEDAPVFGTSSDPRRVFSSGVELRPLFLGRWLTGREIASGRLDLAIDSIGIELGAVFAQPIGGEFPSRPGVQLGLGIELPFFASASGPWIGLHGGVRWSDAAIAGTGADAPADRAMYLAITLSWHQLFLAHAVDAGDRAPR
jgi:hypothetical protein